MAYLFGVLTTRQLAPDLGDASAARLQPYVSALSGLVPAEILAAHAAILAFVTQRTDSETTRIVDVHTLQWAFAALILLSLVLYVVARRASRGEGQSAWQRSDWLRMLIPPLAFVGWTMLQRTTAFDAVAPSLAEPPRYAIAIIGGVALVALQAVLAGKSSQSRVTS